PSGRLCSIAVDHFAAYDGGVQGPLGDLRKILHAIVAGSPDAVTMHKGVATSCWAPYAGRVPLIVQAGRFTPDHRIIEVLATPEEVVRLGGDAIALAIGVRGPNEGRFLRVLAETVEEAVRFKLPVIAHIYPRDYNGVPRIVSDAENIAWAAR